MNNYEVDKMIEQIEEYKDQNRIETLKVNLGASSSDVIFSKEISMLLQEGKVEIQLDLWIQGRYNNIKNELEYKVSFPMKYLSSKTVIAGSFYDKIYSSKELESDPLINEIVDKTMKLLNKNELNIDDFSDMRGTAEVIHCKDEYGDKHSKLVNIDVYKKTYKSYSESIKKKSLEKKYSELDESDIEAIIKELDIDTNTPMGESKKSIVNSFCNQYIWEEYFMYRGYSFASLEAYVVCDYSKVDNIDDVIKELDIKPKFIECPPYRYILKFCPNERFHFKTWVDYLKLLIDFVDYLERIDIEGADFSFNEFWNDSCDYIEIKGHCKVMSDIKFTKELFNWQGKCL
ncbi:TPA: hypothetical protein ACMVTQ_001497 [Clostridioides difficile]|uniref:hypothetical protein n=1 Tax=Clostridioides difficile TaxID=1496 RepID=UPI00038CA486|nr:hypothetical protein [Clostridioides difficile]EQG74238.1 hypothetical protein QKA_3984 [Clostridioides difficile DA00165]EAA0009771.1 hypothetical protein [Clostridioides difficile]EGT3778053.1 hypothetical protein [Clostridioides difficile]EGT3819988.1 hypothetical protein [Clostridioides difficile]EGT3857910.1 hypothetical protein [Clostridioides difficile]